MTPWGLARIEVIASKEHIESELQRGVPMKQIHDALVQSGRVTVTYNSFRRQIQPIRDELKVTASNTGAGQARRFPSRPEQLEKLSEKSAASHIVDSKPSSGFKFNPSCKAEDFF